jgi:hypothetical protein
MSVLLSLTRGLAVFERSLALGRRFGAVCRHYLARGGPFAVSCPRFLAVDDRSAALAHQSYAH